MSPYRPTASFVPALAALVLLILGGFALSVYGSTSARAAEGRVIVLGFDGADARIISEMMERGELPNLRKLASEGTFAPLTSVNPAESATAWASLNSGQNPAKTGIPGFVKRILIGADKRPAADVGHLEMGVREPIESFAGVPIPTWSPLKLGLAVGGATLLAFFVLFAAILRLRAGIALAIAVLLGIVGVWAGMTLRELLPDRVPKMENPNDGAPFWEAAARAGVPCVVLDAAMTFDRPQVGDEKVLNGLGLPDARGDINGFSIYTTDELWFARGPDSSDTDTGSGGNKFKVDERNGKIESSIWGPLNFWSIDKVRRRMGEIDDALAKPETGYKKSQELNDERKQLDDQLADLESQRLSVPLVVERVDGKAKVTLGHVSQELAEGQWSDFYHLSFDLNPLLSIHAVTRVKVLHIDEPHFELYVDVLHIDPARPPFWQPISAPPEFAEELARDCGTFETIGWACMNLPYKDGVIDPITFMQDIEFTDGWRERLTFDRIARDDWRIFMTCLSTPDRVQHMMYQFYDREHPLHDPVTAAQTMQLYGETVTLADTIPAVYRHVDKIVGRVMNEFLRPGDTLIVCGDHGFQTFRREVALNNWLAQEGYLVLKSDLARESDGKSFSRYVDWSKTRAYALGFGGLYLNLKGREGAGVVEPSEADALLDEIAQKFVAATDPQSGKRFGKNAFKARELYQGAHADRLPDLFVCFDAGWRVSWNTTGGGIGLVEEGGLWVPGPVCSDNKKNWSGDHVSVDPSVVPCVFFSNKKFAVPEGGMSLMHVAPTVLALAGVPIPPECDLKPLTAAP